MRAKTYLLVGAAIVAFTASQAQAQDAGADAADSGATATDQADAGNETTAPGSEIVVTGSRIRQTTDTGTTAPVSIISSESITARGFTDAGSALAEMPSMRPPVQANSGTGSNPGLSGQAGVGADYPNLFGLGSGRTLTLINGRRVISTAGGLGDEAVDANIIPIGLLKNIDVVQGGGAVVYGSGAIAGVVNYILRDDFTGVTLDAQAGISERGDSPTLNFRATAGTDFASGRGNIAINLEYSKNDALLRYQREIGLLQPFAVQNLAPGAGTNGIPRQVYIQDYRIPNLSQTGTVVISPALFGVDSLLRVGGQSVRFNADGTALESFDPGTPFQSYPLAVFGGDYDTKTHSGRSGTMIPSVERYVGNLVGHFDLTDDIKLSGELTFAKVIGTLPHEREFLTTFINYLSSIPGLRTIQFTRENPYLTPEVIAQLSAA